MTRTRRRLGALTAGTGLAVASLVGCDFHSPYEHCNRARLDIAAFPGHGGDYNAHESRIGDTDYCTIRNLDGHYHYVAINIHSEAKVWRNGGTLEALQAEVYLFGVDALANEAA